MFFILRSMNARYACMYAHQEAQLHIHIFKYTLCMLHPIHIHTCTRIHTYIYTYMRTHTYTYNTQAYTHIHACTLR